MTRRSWGLLLLQEDGPGLYILTRTRQESDLLLLFCKQFFETWGFESCKRTVQHSDVHIFFSRQDSLCIAKFWERGSRWWWTRWWTGWRPEFIVWITSYLEDIQKMQIPAPSKGCQLVKPKGMVNWHPLRNHLIWYLWKVQVCSLWFIMIYHIWYVFIVCISH